MWNDWVIDATMDNGDGLLCFIPVEGIDTDNPVFVTGMNYLTDVKGFDKGKIRGVIHADGQAAVEKWCKEHPEIQEALEEKDD